MGDHYVPQAYLRGFTDDQSVEMIWVYDKVQKIFFRANVRNVAQEKNFYGPEIEIALNSDIENPANPVLEKLRRREAITDTERYSLSVYIAVMLSRAPRRRLKIKERLPAQIEETIQKYVHSINQIAAATDIQPEIVQRRLQELEELRVRYRSEPPEPVIKEINIPRPNEKIVELIYSMVWRFLIADRGPTRFLTTDNPAFFFEAYGFGREESELSFPISSQMCLLGNWQGGKGAEGLLGIPEAYVKEMNRRNTSAATRFLFYHKRADWLATLAHKNLYLSRIQW
jgi:acylphosphatase